MEHLGIKDKQIFVGDLMDSPLLDYAVDLVSFIRSVEPNGGREKEAETHKFTVGLMLGIA